MTTTNSSGPERDPLAANEDRLGAIRAKLSGVGPGFMLDIRLSKDERDIILRALDDSYALTDADSRAEAAETRYAALAESINEEHTQHEYEVEKVLWRLLVANQQYILALVEGNSNLAGVWLNRLKVFQRLWLESPNWYMQHPDWQNATDDIIGDITGQPLDAAESEDGANDIDPFSPYHPDNIGA